MLGQDLPVLKKCIEWFHCEVYDYDFQKSTRSTQNNFVSIVITCKSIIGKTICVKNVICLLRLKKTIPMILFHVMTTLTKLFCTLLVSF